MEKITAFLMLAVLFAVPTRGQSVLNVYSKSGNVVTYSFKDKPVITYRDDVLVLTTDQVSVEYPLIELDKLTFSDMECSVESITMSQPKGDGIARIYNISGTLVRTVKPSAEDASESSFSIQDLPSGVYVVEQGTQSYKIIKQ